MKIPLDMPRKIITTFTPELKYRCIIEKCPGCCKIFNEIPITEEEVERFKDYGYKGFYKKNKDGLTIISPCPFLEGRLCRIHKEKGYEKKFSTCKNFPFSISELDSGDVLVDIKWTCPGVGFDEGESLTEEFIKMNILDKKYISEKEFQIPDSINENIRLYDEICDFILKLNVPFYERIMVFSEVIRKLDLNHKSEKTGENDNYIDLLNESIYEFIHNKMELIEGINLSLSKSADFDGDPFDDILMGGFKCQKAARQLGIELKIDMEANRIGGIKSNITNDILLIHYLMQTFRETLSLPWSLNHRFFWSLGVIGFVDILSRRIENKESRLDNTRTAIRVVDYLNKHFPKFRDYAFPLYPHAGVHYLQRVIERQYCPKSWP